MVGVSRTLNHNPLGSGNVMNSYLSERNGFRDSAFAVSTGMIKIALIATAVYAAMLGVFALLVVISATWTYCRFKSGGC